MIRFVLFLTLSVAAVMSAPVFNQPSASASDAGDFPFPEKLTYRVEWRLITAGTATLDLTSTPDQRWHNKLRIESAGVLSRLYRVIDTYEVISDPKFCLVSSELDAQENKRHVIARTWFEKAGNLQYEEKDLVKNSAVQKNLSVPSCTREIAGALASLRLLRLEIGKSTTIPITDGKKLANARVESQIRESLSFGGKKYQTIRYEAFLFDNVLYRRKGRLFVWITEDQERIPVQIRLQLGFPIGNVTIQLDKEERTQP